MLKESMKVLPTENRESGANLGETAEGGGERDGGEEGGETEGERDGGTVRHTWPHLNASLRLSLGDPDVSTRLLPSGVSVQMKTSSR